MTDRGYITHERKRNRRPPGDRGRALQRLAPGIDSAVLAAENADETKRDELASAVDGAAGLLEDLRKLLELAGASRTRRPTARP